MALRKLKYLLLVLVFMFVLSSCKGGNTQVNAGVNETSATTTAVTEPTQSTTTTTETTSQTTLETTAAGDPAAFGDFVLPTAGVRPVAVMIDNEGTRVLPQGGMYRAQVIYEILVEGGETRFMPVFWGTDAEMIGPVRSSRHYFLDYVLEHDAIYVHYGWSPMAERDIPKLKINNINGVANHGGIFYDLTTDRNNWQDSYTSMKKILSYSQKSKYSNTTKKEMVFSYSNSDIPLTGGSTASKVTLKFSQAHTCSFEYDQTTGLYNHFRKGKPHMERNNGQQLTAKNILVQVVQCESIKGDKAGRQEIYTVGKGTGYYLTGGKYVKIKWSKASRSAATKYTYEDGTEIKLNPGQTWVELLPAYGKATFE